jgi:hypothetical protein
MYDTTTIIKQASNNGGRRDRAGGRQKSTTYVSGAACAKTRSEPYEEGASPPRPQRCRHDKRREHVTEGNRRGVLVQ